MHKATDVRSAAGQLAGSHLPPSGSPDLQGGAFALAVQRNTTQQPAQQPPKELNVQPQNLLRVPFDDGTVVTVCGLLSAAQHNGRRGRVRRYDPDRGRHAVSLEEAPQQRAQDIWVRPVNLCDASVALEWLDARHRAAEPGAALLVQTPDGQNLEAAPALRDGWSNA